MQLKRWCAQILAVQFWPSVLKQQLVLPQVLSSGLSSSILVKSACALLRQLANSDVIKAEIVEQQGLDLFCKAVDAHLSHAGLPLVACHMCVCVCVWVCCACMRMCVRLSVDQQGLGLVYTPLEV